MAVDHPKEADGKLAAISPDVGSEKSAEKSSKRSVELNDLAKQVAELFSADALSPSLTKGLVRIGEFVGLSEPSPS